MTRLNTFAAIGLAAGIAAGTAARADVTADEVWQDWLGYYTALGQTVTTASQGRQGDTLVIADAVFASTVEGGNVTVTVADIRLRETGDGRVEVTLSNRVPIRIRSKPSSGESLDATMTFSQSGLNMVISGSPGDMVYAMTAPRIGFDVDGLTVDDEAVDLKLAIALADNAGSYSMKTAGGRDVASQFTAASGTFEVAASDPDGGGDLTASGRFGAVQGSSRAVLPEGVNMADLNAALQGGMRAEAAFGYADGSYRMAFRDGDETVDATSSVAGGEVRFAMSKDGLSYGGEGRESRLSMTASALPVPIEATVARTAFNMMLPVSRSDTAAPFAAMVAVVDLALSDGIWNLFDPGAQLPRDPATLIIDLSGAARMLIDVLDPVTAGRAELPGEIEALSLNQLKLSAAGAELSGQGAATFDNSGPVPVPDGAIDLRLVGGNGLIDRLVAMGLLPEEQAMGARMMLGLFAVVAGDDTLTSRIEFRPDGGIYANGQRIR
ncbi:MAG: hypothetical protein CVT84_08220 [Alphaproteobacteria bacterium HGW-Alphaproteobacteria-6]|nr:MAG: hypothetical protein CVT84_08220 [Alphaproteobacteria bacterium HGW-Alphaproteobacteria-6]